MICLNPPSKNIIIIEPIASASTYSPKPIGPKVLAISIFNKNEIILTQIDELHKRNKFINLTAHQSSPCEESSLFSGSYVRAITDICATAFRMQSTNILLITSNHLHKSLF